MASTIQATRSFPRLMRPYLERLVAASGESAYLAVMDADHGFFQYIDGVESPRPVRYWVPVGSRRPIHTGAAGKTLLAYQHEQEVTRLLKEPLPALTAATITDHQVLLAELSQVRQRGYALDRGESQEAVHCVAAPIIDHTQIARAAVSVAGRPEVVDPQIPRLAELVMATARAISSRLESEPSEGLSIESG